MRYHLLVALALYAEQVFALPYVSSSTTTPAYNNPLELDALKFDLEEYNINYSDSRIFKRGGKKKKKPPKSPAQSPAQSNSSPPASSAQQKAGSAHSNSQPGSPNPIQKPPSAHLKHPNGSTPPTQSPASTHGKPPASSAKQGAASAQPKSHPGPPQPVQSPGSAHLPPATASTQSHHTQTVEPPPKPSKGYLAQASDVGKGVLGHLANKFKTIVPGIQSIADNHSLGAPAILAAQWIDFAGAWVPRLHTAGFAAASKLGIIGSTAMVLASHNAAKKANDKSQAENEELKTKILQSQNNIDHLKEEIDCLRTDMECLMRQHGMTPTKPPTQMSNAATQTGKDLPKPPKPGKNSAKIPSETVKTPPPAPANPTDPNAYVLPPVNVLPMAWEYQPNNKINKRSFMSEVKHTYPQDTSEDMPPSRHQRRSPDNGARYRSIRKRNRLAVRSWKKILKRHGF